MLEDIDLVLIHKIDTNISSIIGMISCCFLMYLISTKTVNEMKSYSQILMQGCVIDLFLSITTFFAAPIILLEGSSAYLVVNNFLSDLSHGWRFAITMIWAFVFTLLVPSSPVQFVYRYLVFCSHTNFTRLHYAGFLLVPISNAFIYCVLVFIGCFPKPEDIEVTNKAIGYLFVAKNSTADVTIGLIADAKTIIVLVILAINFSTNGASYMTIVWCSYKMWKLIKESKKLVKKSTREAQNQLTKALFCQMLSPITLVMVPLVYIVATMFLGNPDSRLSIILNLGFSWTPIVNSFTTIWFVRPYRNAATKILFGKCCKVSVRWYDGQTTMAPQKVATTVAAFKDMRSSNSIRNL